MSNTDSPPRAATCRIHMGPMIREMMTGKKELVVQITDLSDEKTRHVCSCRRRAVFYITTTIPSHALEAAKT